jgi:hypothetical protein
VEGPSIDEQNVEGPSEEEQNAPTSNVLTLFSCLAVESGSESQITVPRDAAHQQLGTVIKSN